MKQIDEPAILSTAYFPNIQYISKLWLHNTVYIDVNETYLKQSFRNRCQIAGANGVLDLSIPIIKPNGNKTLTKDIQIEYATKWMQVHWRAIISAYKSSPFFEFFEQELASLYQKQEKFLVDFNTKALELLFNSLDINLDIKFPAEFIPVDENPFDYRYSIHPKKRLQKPDPNFKQINYYQVFQSKHGFLPNLSFIDLVFNEGPQSIYYCKQTASLF